MSLFSRNQSQTFELTEKQIRHEYGSLFITGEVVEKAIKLSWDKWIFTNLRLILVLAACKKSYEFQSIPYTSICRYSTVKSKSDENEVILQIYLHGEEKPVTLLLKDLDTLDGISRILAKRLCSEASELLRMPLGN